MSTINLVSKKLKLPISQQILKNRVIKAPMTECMAYAHSNAPNQHHVQLYEEWAKRSNPAALITGNIMVDRRYLESPNNVVVDDERDLSVLKKWAEAVHKHDVKLIAQISHPGRQSPMSVTFRPVAPSAGVPAVKMVLPAFFAPRGLEYKEIGQIREMFVNTAKVFWKAGFDGVQIHSAHGYLLNQFLSPKINHRTDEYGGSLENRTRLLREILNEVKASIPDKNFIICVKLNTADFQKGGFSDEESMQVVEMLANLGIDFVELSGGNYENVVFMEKHYFKESTRLREAFFIDYVTKLRKRLLEKNISFPIMLSGGFRHFTSMNAALESGEVDILGIARPFCVEPEKISKIVDKNNTEEVELIDADINFKNKYLAQLNSGIENLWHQQQMWLLSNGKDPNLNLGRFWILTGQVFTTYIFNAGRVSKSSWAISLGVLALVASYFFVR